MTSTVPSPSRRPLVLVHGLWDTPHLFRRLVRLLEEHQVPLLVPHLPHRLGAVPLRTLAEQLDDHIRQRWGSDVEVDLLGFSMGGIIGRVWLQQLDGALPGQVMRWHALQASSERATSLHHYLGRPRARTT